jgi:hypothetical protein
MTVLAIPNAISSAISSLSHHGHKKGVHGAQNALDSTSGADDQSGSTQSLFGSLLDTAEQVVGIQTPTSTNPATANSTLTSANASKLSPAQMISAARQALQKT